MSRTFLVQPGRTVTLPQGLAAGPGATNMRLPPGAVVTLDDAKCVEFGRFIAGRERAGDWREIDAAAAPTSATEPVFVPDPNKPTTGPARLVTGGPVGSKEG